MIAQRQVEEKRNEISAACKIVGELDLQGVVVTMDAMHTQTATAAAVAEKKRLYILALNDNQPTRADRLVSEPRMESRPNAVEKDRGYGRIEKRSVRVRDVPADDPLPGFASARQMAISIRERRRLHERPPGDPEVAFAISNLSRPQAPPQALGQLLRSHSRIENARHYVRYLTFSEDRSRIRTGSPPRVMASMRNLAISAVTVLCPPSRYSRSLVARGWHAKHAFEADGEGRLSSARCRGDVAAVAAARGRG